MNNDKLNLVERAQNGDKTALRELIRLEENNIYTTLFYLKRNDNDLTDIMQEVYLKLIRNISSLKNPKYFSTWLNKIIVHSYYDYLRKKKKKIETFFKGTELSAEYPDNSTIPFENILNKELDYVIKKTISNLPIHYKIPITLREIQGLSYDEISSITNSSIGTVKSRISRARGIIKNEIEKYENG